MIEILSEVVSKHQGVNYLSEEFWVKFILRDVAQEAEGFQSMVLLMSGLILLDEELSYLG